MRILCMLKLSTLSTELSTEKTRKTLDISRNSWNGVDKLSKKESYRQEKDEKSKSYPQSYQQVIHNRP